MVLFRLQNYGPPLLKLRRAFFFVAHFSQTRDRSLVSVIRLRSVSRCAASVGSTDFRVCVTTQISGARVEPAFRRALWIQAHAHLKVSATGPGSEFPHRLFSLCALL